MADNLDQTTVADNQDQTTEAPETQAPETQAPAFSWKSKVGEDLSKAPSLGKFQDTPEGLQEVAKSYINLEKLLSHEKVPLPKGSDDVEAQAAFNKAIGVPGSPDEYGLPDAVLPEGASDMTFDKATFQAIMHKYHLTPAQAKGLWESYTQMSGQTYQKHMQDYKATLDKNINTLRQEWGDAYAGNVELADMVISKFSDDQDMANFLTSTLAKDPAGIKFLSKIGTQFSENKIGEFQYKRFSLTPEEASNEITRIQTDPKHPYNNESAPRSDRDKAIDHVNRLIAISMGKKT